MKTFVIAALAIAISATPASAQDAAPVDATPASATPSATVEATPITTSTTPTATARSATEEQRAAFERELSTLSGLARADRLWTFVRTFPDDLAAPRYEAEAHALIEKARQESSSSPLVLAINAVIQSSTPAARSEAIAALESLHDARAVPFLKYVALRDRELETRTLAARTIGHFGTTEAIDTGLALAEDANETVPVRIAALEGVSSTGQSRVGAAVLKLAQDAGQPDDLRRAAFASLNAHFPALAAKAGPAPVASSSGRALSIVVGALSGGYSLALVGALSPGGSSGVATGVGAFGGLVIGGVSAALLSASYPITQGDAVYLGSGAVWSVPLGYMLGSLVGGASADCEAPACPAIMLATPAAAMGATWLTREPLKMTVRDGLELNLITAATTSLAGGIIAQFTPTGDDRPALGALAFGMTAGFVGGALAAPRLHLDNEGLLLAGIAAADFAATASLLGDALIPDYVEGPLGSTTWNANKSQQTTGLTFLGAGLGVGAALAANTFWKPTYSDVGLLTASSIDGLLLGAGIGLLADDTDGASAEIGAAITGLVAVGATAALLRPLDLKIGRGDPVLLTMGQGFAAWQALGWGSYFSAGASSSDDAIAKAGLIGTGLAGIGLLAATQFIDEPAWNLGWAFSGGVWGGWLAGWSTYAANADGEDILLASLVGSGAGLALSSVLVSPLVGVSPSSLAWTSVGGVAGMTLGTMGAVFLTGNSSATNEHPVAIGNVVGSVIGLGVGVGIARLLTSHQGAAGDADTGPGFFDDVPAPTPSFAPMTDANGRFVQGMQTSLMWRL